MYAEGGACARCPLAETVSGRLLLGDVAARRLQRRKRRRGRKREKGAEWEREREREKERVRQILAPPSVLGAPEYLSISPPDGAIPSLWPLGFPILLAHPSRRLLSRRVAASQATPPHEQPAAAAAAAAAAPAAAPRRPDGDARNGVEESYAGGETNQGLTNDGDWSRRSSDTQRARARDKLPHTPGLRWIVARPSVRYQLPSAHATATANAEPRQ